jgi:hypothetical protein
MHRLHRLHMMVERGTGITLGPTLEPPRNAIEADPTSEAGFDVLHEPTDQVDLELNSSVRMRAHVCSYVCDAQKTETSSVALANRLDELLDDAFEGANAERFGHETRQVRERSALVSGHAPVAPSWGSTDFVGGRRVNRLNPGGAGMPLARVRSPRRALVGIRRGGAAHSRHDVAASSLFATRTAEPSPARLDAPHNPIRRT